MPSTASQAAPGASQAPSGTRQASAAIPQAASRTGRATTNGAAQSDAAMSETRAALIRHLLDVDDAAPVLLLVALGNAATQIASLEQGPESDSVFEGHMLAAMECLARFPPEERHPNVYIELFDGLSNNDRARQAKTWDGRHRVSHWPFTETEHRWGPLLAAIAALEMGAERVVIHLSAAHLTSRDATHARRSLLEQRLIAGVVSVQLPLSTPAAERDCYLIVARDSKAVSFYESPKSPLEPQEQPIREVALLRSEELLNSPDAGLSLFDAKVVRERNGGCETLGDIAKVLSSAGSAIRRSGGLSDDDALPMRYISIVDFDHGTLKPKGKYFAADDSFDVAKYQLIAGDILIARNATAGGIQIVTYDPADQTKPLIASENVLVLRLNKHIFHPYALYLYLAFGRGSAFLADCRAGAALGSISPKRLLDIPAPIVTVEDDRQVRKLYWNYLEMINEYEEMLTRFSLHEQDARMAAQVMDLHAGTPVIP